MDTLSGGGFQSEIAVVSAAIQYRSGPRRERSNMSRRDRGSPGSAVVTTLAYIENRADAPI
jgi:hypothetical protein